MEEGSLVDLLPVRPSNLRIIEFDYDVSEYLGARTIADCPDAPTMHGSYVVVFGSHSDDSREPLLVDASTARALELSDGTRTVAEVLAQLESEGTTSLESDSLDWVEMLFRSGLLTLRSKRAIPENAGNDCVVTCKLSRQAGPA